MATRGESRPARPAVRRPRAPGQRCRRVQARRAAARTACPLLRARSSCARGGRPARTARHRRASPDSRWPPCRRPRGRTGRRPSRTRGGMSSVPMVADRPRCRCAGHLHVEEHEVGPERADRLIAASPLSAKPTMSTFSSCRSRSSRRWRARASSSTMRTRSVLPPPVMRRDAVVCRSCRGGHWPERAQVIPLADRECYFGDQATVFGVRAV